MSSDPALTPNTDPNVASPELASQPLEASQVDSTGTPNAEEGSSSSPPDLQGDSNTEIGKSAATGKGEIPTFVATSQELDDKRKKAEEKVPLQKILRIYVLPLVTVVGFLGIILLLVVPGVSTLFGNFDKITELGDEVSDLDQDLNDLQALNSIRSQINRDLDSVNNLIPSAATEVASFQRKIVDLARNRGIKVVEVETVEQILKSGESDISALGIIEIPNNFDLQGDLSSLKEFILEIQNIDDFIIIGEMSLKAERNQPGIWGLDIILIKYQFQQPDENNKLEQIYARVPIRSQANGDVLDLVRR